MIPLRLEVRNGQSQLTGTGKQSPIEYPSRTAERHHSFQRGKVAGVCDGRECSSKDRRNKILRMKYGELPASVNHMDEHES
jgi:hypothetical protein